MFLTSQLAFPLNLCAQSLVAAATAAGTSEAELLARFPALAFGAAVLFGLGLVCDGFLLVRLRKARADGGDVLASLLNLPPKPWNLHDLALATSTLVLVVISGDLVVGLATRVAGLDKEASIASLLGAEVLFRLGLIGAFAWFLRARCVTWSDAFGLRARSTASALRIGALAYLAILPPLSIVFAIYNRICRAFGLEETQQDIAELLINTNSTALVGLIIVFAIVVAPVFEEMFFRGFAYPALKHRWGAPRALLVVSAAFAVAHLHAPSIGPLFALAIGLGLAYELTGSILAPIAMHALFNATNVAMLLYVRAHS